VNDAATNGFVQFANADANGLVVIQSSLILFGKTYKRNRCLLLFL
jgi:hypothetical protein